MTDPLPDWVRQTPNLESLHNLPDVRWGGYNGQGSVPLPSLPDLADFIKLFLDKFLGQVVQAVAGVLIPGLPSFDQLRDWAQNIPGLSQFLDLLDKLSDLFGGADLSNPLDPTTVWNTVVTAFMLPLNLLLGPNSPLSAANLFGDISKLNIGALTNNQPNLVLGSFPNAASIFDNPKWSFDAAVTHTAGGTGSARTTGGGVVRGLRSKPRTVDADQKLTASAFVKCQALTGSGAAFHVDVVRFSGTADAPVQLGIDRVASLTQTPGDHDWAQLSASYTVPDDGTTMVALRLVVDSTVTGGTVWFDDAVLKQVGSLLLDWMPEAVSKFLSIFGIFGPAQTVDQMQQAWNNLLSIFGIGSPSGMLGSLNLAAIWSNIVQLFINPLGFFANLVGGVLPDSQKPKWLQDLNDGIANLFNGSSDTNTGIPNALDSLANILGIGHQAQSSADNANIGVQILNARLDAVGVVGYDEFDYSSANILPSDKYALSSAGPGGGNYGPNGKGQLEWKPSGFTAREKVYKRTDLPLSTDNGVVTAVWSTKIKDPLFSDGYGYLQGRMLDANNDTYIRARIDNNTAIIQAIVGGAVTSIGSSVNVSTANGDVWEFWYGTLTNPYKLWLKQNGSVVLSVEDTGHISQVGASYRMCGIGGRADNYSAIFQIPPPTLNGWTWRDQNAASAA